MSKRLFIAINLQDFVREELAKWQVCLKELPFRWVKPESIHVTLCFIGEVEKGKIEEIKQSLKNISKNHKSFEIKLDEISFGPNQYMPRMIWVNGSVSKELKNLQQNISESLKGFCNRVEDREYKLHITIGRVIDIRKIKNISPIRENIDIKFRAESFELMESELLPSGSEYKVVESFKLP